MYDEPGGDVARAARRTAATSAVNYCEVLTDLIEMGSTPGDAAPGFVIHVGENR